ncbi:unnamed protein product, partial [Sphacelaria rigidula]
PVLGENLEIRRSQHKFGRVNTRVFTLPNTPLQSFSVVWGYLHSYCAHWCEGLMMVRDRNEKEAAFRGLCLVIRHNPGGVVKVW